MGGKTLKWTAKSDPNQIYFVPKVDNEMLFKLENQINLNKKKKCMFKTANKMSVLLGFGRKK